MVYLAHFATRSRRSRLAVLGMLLAIALTALASSGAGAATWAIQETPESGGREETLATSSCASERFCVVVGQVIRGFTEKQTLAESWNGTTWSLQTTPNVREAEINALLGVSCKSERFCMAVGYAFNELTSREVAITERWNGREWTLQTLALPAGATEGIQLLAVSCTSESACTAVGWYNEARGLHLLVERWNGREWVIQSTPNTGGTFSGVSCSSETACTAVSGTAMVADSWNGREWTQQEMPRPSERFNYNLGVSCISASSCVAVGEWEVGRGSNAFSEVWNGERWTIKTPQTPAGATTTAILGVSCTSATACTGVGGYHEASGNQLTLAESWNGREWILQSSPNRRAATMSRLAGVSCTSATLCTAAGLNVISSAYEALVERYS